MTFKKTSHVKSKDIVSLASQQVIMQPSMLLEAVFTANFTQNKHIRNLAASSASSVFLAITNPAIHHRHQKELSNSPLNHTVELMRQIYSEAMLGDRLDIVKHVDSLIERELNKKRGSVVQEDLKKIAIDKNSNFVELTSTAQNYYDLLTELQMAKPLSQKYEQFLKCLNESMHTASTIETELIALLKSTHHQVGLGVLLQYGVCMLRGTSCKLEDVNHLIDSLLFSGQMSSDTANLLALLFYLRGILSTRANNNQEAVESFEKAIRTDSNFVHAYVAVGQAYERLNRPEEALVNYNKAVGLDAKLDIGLRSRSKLYYSMDQRDHALRDLEQWMTLSPNDIVPKYLRAKLLIDLERHSEAIGDLTMLIQKHKYPIARVYRAKAYFKQKKYDKVIDDCTKSIELFLLFNAVLLHPHFSDIFLMRGIAYYKLRKFSEAVEDFTLALENALKAQNKPELLLSRGRSYMKLNKGFEAISDFSDAIDHKCYQAYNERALVYIQMKLFPKAQQDIDHLLNIDPNNVQAICLKAYLALLCGKLTECNTHLHNAAQIDDENAHVYFYRSKLHESQRRLDLALEDAHTAFVKDPDTTLYNARYSRLKELILSLSEQHHRS